MSLGCNFTESIQRQLCNGPKLGISSTLTEAFDGSVPLWRRSPCIDNRCFHHSITTRFIIGQDIELQ